ncbi:MAG: hypothetical protein K8T20_02375 [Planctomycetes bacterium]|nr:hypothetical protein [Planctomycetota bacterium]
MSAERITRTCSINIGPGFERRVEDGDLCFSGDKRTVWVALYESKFREPHRSVNELYSPSRKPDEEWERSQPGRFGRAYFMREDGAGKRSWTLTTLTASARRLALVSFYFEEEADLDWAVRAWDTLRVGNS